MNVQYLLSFLRTRGCYRYFVAFQLIVFLGLALYQLTALVKGDDTMLHKPIVVFIEIAITCICILEIIVRVLSHPNTFFKNCWNIVDLINICLVVILFSVSYLYGTQNLQNDVLPVILLGVRYTMQMVRSALALKACQDIKEASMLDFDLNIDHDLEHQQSQGTSQRKISLVDMRSSTQSTQN